MSEVSIVNQALARVGQPGVVNLADADRWARVANLHYAPKRDTLLRDYRWRFAIRRAEIPALAENPLFGYAHQYGKPTDCLRVLSINEEDPEFDLGIDTDLWTIEGDAILTDAAPPIKVRYVARIIDPTRFDASFVDAFALFLAMHFAPLARESGPEEARTLREEFEHVIARARNTNAIEGRPRRRVHTWSSWTHGRGGW